MLERYWPNNCCLCNHEVRIRELEIELAIYKPAPSKEKQYQYYRPVNPPHDHGNATGSTCIIGVADCDAFMRLQPERKTYASGAERPQTPHTRDYRCEFCRSTESLHIEEGLQCWKQQALDERHDVVMIAHEVSQVYCHITGDKLSKPNYEAQVMIDEADDYYHHYYKVLLEELVQDGVVSDEKQWYFEQIAEIFSIDLPPHEADA
jgi:hypothetical protein